ncbi:ferritin-like domain-containing protein [Lacrimispora defluvii]|uniref:Ferritin-like domain-containing protein n=1 Tax=Lacrimispora defluvii TaxID=2719233 RepID=A0ABX1VRG7_9FIRM|nr:ferritin-like domain-containing protein [Lacrimispora defluvii]NNJ30903.1 ferritin-like domain-containing protein [Lacrimispora defluvii]
MINYEYGGYVPYNYGYATPYMSVMNASNMQGAQQSADIFTFPQNLPNALDLIQQGLAGENEDRLFYSWLIENAPSDEDKQIISGIRDNEIGHYALFKQLFNEITGVMPQQVQEEQFVIPESYCSGLSRALLGEQNAVIRYRNILYAMEFREHINMMIEIITDELRHGILYNYLYTKNGCRG